ncbi:hypothetical protein ES707_12233 [subsurface metagenome]
MAAAEDRAQERQRGLFMDLIIRRAKLRDRDDLVTPPFCDPRTCTSMLC